MSPTDTLRDIQRLVWTACFAAFIAVSALLVIPTMLVPFTLQTMFVLLAGLVLGPRYGVLAVLLYMSVGFIGLPIFAGLRSGVSVIWGPTGGYLISFLIMAYLSGLYRNVRNFSFFWCFMVCLSAVLINHIFGALWLAWSQQYNLAIVFVGIIPFLIIDIIKALAACSLYAHMHKYGLLPK